MREFIPEAVGLDRGRCANRPPGGRTVGGTCHGEDVELTSPTPGPKADTQISGPVRATRERNAAHLALSELLQRQHGVVTRGQALACGLADKLIDRRIRSGGPWQRLLPGVYLTLTGTPTQDQLDTAALLYAGSGSTLTGLAALRRHGARRPTASGTAIDVLIPAKRRRMSTGFVVIRLTTRLPQQVCYSGPLQYVLPARAVADAVRRLTDLASVRSIVAGAVQTRLCTIDQLVSELQEGAVQGSALLRKALAEVVDGIRSSTEAELKDLLKRGRLPVPMFNARLYFGEELVAVVDAWWPDLGVVVEVDSKEWHLAPDKWEQTMNRHARMTALGLLVLHFSPRQIKHEPDQVLSIVRQALESRRGHPMPPVRTLSATG
jgi:very-short-patch-repair endonuclease